MSIPDAGSAAFAQSATETAPDAMFGALLAAFAPLSDADAPKNTPGIATAPDALEGEQAGLADAVLTSAAPPIQENPVRWMAQLDFPALPQERDALPLIRRNLSLLEEQQQPDAPESVVRPGVPAAIAMPDTNLPEPKAPVLSGAFVPGKGQSAKSEQPPPAIAMPDTVLPEPKPPTPSVTPVANKGPGAKSEQALPPAIALPDSSSSERKAPILSVTPVPDKGQAARSEQARPTAIALPDSNPSEPKPPILSVTPVPDKGQAARPEQAPPISIALPDSSSSEPKPPILSVTPVPDKGQSSQSDQARPISIALPDSSSSEPKPSILLAASMPDKGEIVESKQAPPAAIVLPDSSSSEPKPSILSVTPVPDKQSPRSEQAPPHIIVPDERASTLPRRNVATPVSPEETSPPVPIAASKDDGDDIPTALTRLTGEAAPAEEDHAEPQPDAPAASAPKPKTENTTARASAHGKQGGAPQRDFLSEIPSRVAVQFLAALPESDVQPAAAQPRDPQTKPDPKHEASHRLPAGGEANVPPLNVNVPAKEQGALQPMNEAPKDAAPNSAEGNSISEADAAASAPEDLPRTHGRHATKEPVADQEKHQTAEIAQALAPNIPANPPPEKTNAPETQDVKFSLIQTQPEPAPFAATPDSEQAASPTGSMAPPAEGNAPRPLSSQAGAGPVKAPVDNEPVSGAKLAKPSESLRPARSDAGAAASDDGNAPKSTATPDRPDRPVRTASTPAENLAKNEPVPAAPNGAQMSQQPPVSSHHGLPDSPAVPNLPAAPVAPNDPSTAVKLAFSGPNSGASSAPSETPSFDALALKIATRSADGDRNFSIRLDPPELGRIEVNLNVNSDGHAEAELRADRPQTLELLQRDASALERALKDAGLNLAGSLAFSLKGEGKSGAWRDAQSSQRGRIQQIAAIDAASATAALAGSAALAAHAYDISTARLDIRV
jgi:hypothetical protein